MAKRGLGKGIDSLLPSVSIDSLVGGIQVRQLATKDIVPNPKQPRKTFDKAELAELAHSIGEHGVLQPLMVSAQKNNKYMLVAGERRLRAAKKAGLKSVPCIVKQVDELQHLELSIIENVQRKDLDLIELTDIIARLHDDFNQSYDQISHSLGKSQQYIVSVSKLIELPDDIKADIKSGAVNLSASAALVALIDLPKDQAKLHRMLVRYNWTAAQAKEFADRARAVAQNPSLVVKRPRFVRDPWVDKLGDQLEAKVVLRKTPNGSGAIHIRYKNEKELKRLKKLLEN